MTAAESTAKRGLGEDAIIIEPVSGPRGVKRFIAAGKVPYKDDPAFVAPLEFEIGARLNPAVNPMLKISEHQLFVASRNGVDVGRISAIVNPLHLERYNDATGHFGFIDALDDGDVFAALISAAADFVRARGMTRLAGPYNFSVNEECGLLVDGFDTPPYVMMPHARRYYAMHLEALGFEKAIDLYALWWRNRLEFIPPERRQFVDKILASPKVSIRRIDMRRFNEEIATIVEIFNDAWSENWGFIPFTPDQAAHMAKELRPVIADYNVVICEYNGEPAAFALVLPNINEAIADFDGKLLPFNWAKLIWRLKIKGLSTARMPLMGIRKRMQRKPVGIAFAYKMIELTNTINMEKGLKESEMSWILESNGSMISILKDMGCDIYKTYRIYAKDI